MVVIKVSGGLGNQMFQYAFGFILNKKLRIHVKYDFSFFSNNKNIHNNILFDKVFNIDIEIVNNQELINLIGINRFWIFKKINKILNLNNSKYIFEDDYKDQIILNNKLNDYYLDGYWQNWEYIKDYKKEIMKKFTFKPILSKKINEIEKKILNKKSAIIHFRRGDYKDKKNTVIFHELGKSYYQKAINLIKKKNRYIVFYIFSDDIGAAKKFFNFENNLTFVNINKDKNSYIDMYLMSLSKNIIISNSTFSWWAAWLGENKKTVVAPKLWFKQPKKTHRYYLPTWHIL